MMNTNNSDNRAVIYARFSSHNQRDESIDAQERACREYAQRNGLQIIEIYADRAKSGTSSEREEFQRMIKDSGDKKFRYLLIHKLDRFSRNKYDAVIFKKKLRMNGVTIISVTENLDDSPESIMLESVIEGMAQYYSSNLAREVRKGQRETALQHKHLGGTPPLGLEVDPNTRKYVINEKEAEIVRIIFEKYADGIGYNQILNYLNSMGYRTKRGNQFGKNSLYSILENEKYVGTYVFNKRLEKNAVGKRNPTVRPREEWIIAEDVIPAIIDQRTFDIVQAKMSENKRKAGQYTAKEIYLLSGLIFCGECGRSMCGNVKTNGRRSGNYASYRCSGRHNKQGCHNKEIRRDYIDNYVLDELYNRLFSKVSLKNLTEMLNDYNAMMSSQSDSEINAIKTQIQDIDRKIGNLLDLVSDGGVKIDTIGGKLKELEAQRQEFEDTLKELELKNKASLISEEQVKEIIIRSGEFIRAHNISECRNFIKSYIEKVIVYDEKVEVIFKVNVFDKETGEVVPMKSKETVKNLRLEYQDVEKGHSSAVIVPKKGRNFESEVA